jgi:hypothetical protein
MQACLAELGQDARVQLAVLDTSRADGLGSSRFDDHDLVPKFLHGQSPRCLVMNQRR